MFPQGNTVDHTMDFPEVLQPCYTNCIEDASSVKSFWVSTEKKYLIQFFSAGILEGKMPV